MRRVLSICLLLPVLAACSNVQELFQEGVALSGASGLTSNHRITRNGHWVLPQNTSFYVALSGSGEAGVNIAVPAAPAMEADPLRIQAAPPSDRVSDILTDEVARRFPRVMRGNEIQTLYGARMSAVDHGIDYVIFPRLLFWQDTAGTWSEVADTLRYREKEDLPGGFGLDKARVQLTLLESKSGRVMDVVSIDTQAGVLTLYGENPQHLLVAAVSRYVDSLVP